MSNEIQKDDSYWMIIIFWIFLLFIALTTQ
jgi:hypothetical protein